MSQDDDTEKSHEASQRKLDEARKRGELVKSTDVSLAAGYAGLLLAFLVLGQPMMLSAGQLLAVLLDQAGALSGMVFAGAPAPVLRSVLWQVLGWASGLFVIPAMAVLLSLLAQRAIVFAPSKIAFKSQRIDPVQNAKNKFGRSGLFEFGKSFVKLMVYTLSLTAVLVNRLPEIAGAQQGSPGMIAALMGKLCAEFLFVIVLVSAGIAVIDYVWQRYEHFRKNRMSRKELTDEAKDAEGDPHLKQRRRQKAQEIAMSQMMRDLPGADVVIVNPTHYAVALKWSRDAGEAPRCIAKGVDEIALRMREIANENGVPIRSDPPTARALYAETRVGQEISPDHYRAVAAAIRFAERIRRKSKVWRP
ncbi:EscU/YscU/HrcU family type III secretion system export apparatus switch protein [Shimia biformata]|uniref:EscU/YscU/HrcU family type III secretion system export apparatus switch protein n=1 Tax=Shimia biformata TaxID=1294299 RepID=UPI0019528CFB|nr:flagellar type III secretion system protein FlhB [Shimia biformata]